MAQSMNFVGALFMVTLILEAPLVLAGDIADKVRMATAAAANCNKQCEGKGTPAEIDRCKETCSLTEHSTYAVIGAGACRQDCDRLKNDQSSFNLCQEKCREKYEGRVSQITQDSCFKRCSKGESDPARIRICRKACMKNDQATST